MMACRNEDMFNLLTCDEVDIIPDGIGVVKVVEHVRKIKNVSRNTGVELVSFLLNELNNNNMNLFVYGAKKSVLNDFILLCDKKYPNIHIVGAFDGYENDPDTVRERIIHTDADSILVALGTPRQELFINSFFSCIDHGICIGVGGSIDVLSGNKSRAPAFFINHNLEWLYRICKEPKRIGRFIRNTCSFIMMGYLGL